MIAKSVKKYKMLGMIKQT